MPKATKHWYAPAHKYQPLFNEINNLLNELFYDHKIYGLVISIKESLKFIIES